MTSAAKRSNVRGGQRREAQTEGLYNVRCGSVFNVVTDGLRMRDEQRLHRPPDGDAPMM